MITPILDPADARVAAYTQVKERDLVGREGLFVAEGEVVLRTLVRDGRHEVLSVLLAQKRVEGLADILAGLPPGTPVYSAGQDVLDSVAGFHIHRGILALGRRAEEPSAKTLLQQAGPRALVLALFGVSNHDNMGGLFRNAAAFGADAVLLDPTCCDPLYRKAIRVSVGAALTVPFARVESDPIALFEETGFTALALSPAGQTTLARLKRPARAAVMLGAEGPGLPADLLARTTTVSIPMHGQFDSLNVATTSGIVLHHLVFN